MHDRDNLRRREFLGTVGGLSIATLISQGLFAADEHQEPGVAAAPANRADAIEDPSAAGGVDGHGLPGCESGGKKQPRGECDESRFV